MRKFFPIFLSISLLTGVGVYAIKYYKTWYPQTSSNEILVYQNTPLAKPIRIKTNRITGSKTQNSIALLQTILKEGNLVFDVGANVGLKADLYLDCGAKVVCIEPQPACVAVLQEKYKENPKVSIEAIGLDAEEGEKELCLCKEVNALSTFSKDQTEQSRFAERGYRWDERVKVPMSTLDQMISKYGKPFYCKLDVENFEYEVLQGLHQPIPYLSFECNSEQWENSKRCIERLVSLGYKKFNFAVGATDLLLFPEWLSVEEFVENVEKILKSKDFSEVWGFWGDIYTQS